MAASPTVALGGRFPVTVLSVPTGQFVPWALADGAFSSPPKFEVPKSLPARCVSWSGDQVADVVVQQAPGRPAPSIQIESITYTMGFPHLGLPEDCPERDGQVFSQAERLRLQREIEQRNLLGSPPTWRASWVAQCLSPIVIVGDGVDYLMRQREMLVTESNWLGDMAAVALGYDSGKVREPSHILRTPYSVLSQQATTNHRWIRRVRPRLVVYTRWSYFVKRPPSSFTGCPTVVLSNRRAEGSIACADETEAVQSSAPEWIAELRPPRGIGLRYLEFPVTHVDRIDGDGGGDDDLEDF